MRLEILDRKYSIGTKIMFAAIRLLSGHPVPDAAKLAFYRRDFYGSAMSRLTHAVMRGDSEWSVADRELMAALVAKVIQSPFCIAAHSATAALAYGDESKVQAALSDLEAAAVKEPLRGTLRTIRKVAGGESLQIADVRDALAAGATRRQIEEALAVCFTFSVMARLANAFGFAIPSRDEAFAGAKFLLSRGYR